LVRELKRAGCLLLTTLLSCSPEAVPSNVAPAVPDVFDRPAAQDTYDALQGVFERTLDEDDPAIAVATARQALGHTPRDRQWLYQLALAEASAGQSDAALSALERAVEFGYRDVGELLGSDRLASLRSQPRFALLVGRAKIDTTPPPPAWEADLVTSAISGGLAPVTSANTAWDYQDKVFRTGFTWPKHPGKGDLVTGDGPWQKQLREWGALGTCAGHEGDLYDNCDLDHSVLDAGRFPRLARISYGEEPRARGLASGLQLRFLHGGVVLGNSSMAVVEPDRWRSQVRLAYTTPGAVLRLHHQYRHDHFYIYPEHRDHDPGHNGQPDGGYGDVFPANTPYVILSQGSSWSDLPFLEAVAATLAAFQPETKARLRETGLLMPTVQLILRQCQTQVPDREAYLTGVAHPTVFDAAHLDVLRMITMAHGIAPDALPPLVNLRVVAEENDSASDPGKLFDSPQAIARVFRSLKKEMILVVSALESYEAQGKSLQYHWKVLRGDPTKISVQPLNRDASVVEIRLPWQERGPALPGSPLESNRIDIGAFVESEAGLSAPAFISVTCPDNEWREYAPDGRLLVRDYTHKDKKDNYVDPLIEDKRDWRDEFHYDENGSLTGWTRVRLDRVEEFRADEQAESERLEGKK